MDPRLQEIIDHHEIRKLLASYCRGCDRADEAQMAGAYADESWDDHGPNKCDGREFAGIITRQIAETQVMCSHQLGQSSIAVAGYAATAETHFVATNRYPDSDRLHQIGGRYVDNLRREGDGWRITRRICVREWSISHHIAEDWLATAGFVASAVGQGDPSYAELGLTHSGLPVTSG